MTRLETKNATSFHEQEEAIIYCFLHAVDGERVRTVDNGSITKEYRTLKISELKLITLNVQEFPSRVSL